MPRSRSHSRRSSRAFIFAIGVHLFLAFPTGRLQTRTDRAVVAFAYVATVILAPAGAMFRETLPGCADCPANLLFVADIPALAAAIDVVATLLAVGLLLVTIALVIRNWRGASPESRLALDPVLAVSGLATVSLLATVVAQGLGLDGAVAALGALDALFVLIPIAFLAGLLRVRLHRAREADLEVERLQAQLRAQLVGGPRLAGTDRRGRRRRAETRRARPARRRATAPAGCPHGPADGPEPARRWPNR